MSVNADALRELAPSWSLDGDRKLLQLLQNIHQNIMEKCARATARLDEMSAALDLASVSLRNVSNRFASLGNTQFIESRVYEDDDVHVEAAPAASHQERRPAATHTDDIVATLHQFYHTPSPSEPAVQARDLYSHRRLPHVIGTAQWKKQWHGGVVEEESDVASARERARERASETPDLGVDDDQSLRAAHTNALQGSYSVESLTSEDSSSHAAGAAPPAPPPPPAPVPAHHPLVKPTAAELAAELARRLGGAGPLPAPGPRPPAAVSARAAHTPPLPAHQPQARVTANIFTEEPPPMDETADDDQSDSNDDIFADLHTDKLFNSDIFISKPKYGGLFDDIASQTDRNSNESPRDIFDDFADDNRNIRKDKTEKKEKGLFEDDDELFSDVGTSKLPKVKSSKEPPAAKGLFDSEEEDEGLFSRRVQPTDDKPSDQPQHHASTQAHASTRAHNTKKPVGGISLFGSKHTADIGAAIMKNRQSSSSDDDQSFNDSSKKDTQSKYYDKNNMDSTDDDGDIFTSISNSNAKFDDLFAKSIERNKVTGITEINSNVIVSKDDNFPENTNEKERKINESVNNSDSLDELFNNEKELVKDKIETKKTREFTDDIFENSDIIASAHTNKKRVSTKKLGPAKDLFGDDDDDDDDLFSDNIVPQLLPKIKTIKSSSLFDDDDDIDDLFKISDSSNKPEDARKKFKSNEMEEKKVSSKSEYKISVETKNIKNNNIVQETSYVPEEKTYVPESKPYVKLNKNGSKETLPIFEHNINNSDSKKSDLLQHETKSDSVPVLVSQMIGKSSFTSSDNFDDLFSNYQQISKSSDQANNYENSKSFHKQAEYEDSTVHDNVFEKNSSEPNIVQTEVSKNSRDITKADDDLFTDKQPINNVTLNNPVDNIYDTIFDDVPPVFSRTTESKKSKNVNALFDDDSDDERLFLKTHDNLSIHSDDSKSVDDFLPPSEDRLFDIFHTEIGTESKDNFQINLSNGNIITEPTEIKSAICDNEKNKEDAKEERQNAKVSGNAFEDLEYLKITRSENVQKIKEIISPMTENFNVDSEKVFVLAKYEDEELKNTSNNDSKSTITKDKETPKISSASKELTQNNKVVGKLRPMNLNIDVKGLLPGASPKKLVKPDLRSEKSDHHTHDIKTNREIETKQSQCNADTTDHASYPKTRIVKSVSFDKEPESPALVNTYSKERAKIAVKRRPSTRKARIDAIRNSAIDLEVDSPGNGTVKGAATAPMIEGTKVSGENFQDIEVKSNISKQKSETDELEKLSKDIENEGIEKINTLGKMYFNHGKSKVDDCDGGDTIFSSKSSSQIVSEISESVKSTGSLKNTTDFENSEFDELLKSNMSKNIKNVPKLTTPSSLLFNNEINAPPKSISPTTSVHISSKIDASKNISRFDDSDDESFSRAPKMSSEILHKSEASIFDDNHLFNSPKDSNPENKVLKDVNIIEERKESSKLLKAASKSIFDDDSDDEELFGATKKSQKLRETKIENIHESALFKQDNDLFSKKSTEKTIEKKPLFSDGSDEDVFGVTQAKKASTNQEQPRRTANRASHSLEEVSHDPLSFFDDP